MGDERLRIAHNERNKWKARAEKAEAEIARLQGWLEERDAFIVHNDIWAKFVGQFPLAALKPDTGE